MTADLSDNAASTNVQTLNLGEVRVSLETPGGLWIEATPAGLWIDDHTGDFLRLVAITRDDIPTLIAFLIRALWTAADRGDGAFATWPVNEREAFADDCAKMIEWLAEIAPEAESPT